MKKSIVLGILASLMVLSFTACSKKQENKEPETFIDVSEDGKTVYANFDDSDKGVGGGTGITVAEGEHILVDCALESGDVLVKITKGGADMDTVPSAEDEAVFERLYSAETVTEQVELESGDYMIFVNVEKKAKGKITFTEES